VYVTAVPGSSFDDTLVACGRLRDLGMVPVPHVAARGISSAAQWQSRLQALKQRAGVDQMLLVAGSQDTPVGAFTSSLDVLDSGLVARPGMASLALAAHPEGSPSITADELAHALQRKNAFAVASGLPTRLLTQFVFDAQPVLAWEEQVRGEGNQLPIHLGLAGLASMPTLLRYARLCGVGASMQALARQRWRLLKLASGVDPGGIVVAVAEARLRDSACLIRRLHFFPFGALQATLAWASAVARGDFEISQDHKHLEVATTT
jgi:methylenetetrahydrofolate reductase (NADPH)